MKNEKVKKKKCYKVVDDLKATCEFQAFLHFSLFIFLLTLTPIPFPKRCLIPRKTTEMPHFEMLLKVMALPNFPKPAIIIPFLSDICGSRTPPNELDKKSEKFFARLAKNGVFLLNQSVLLKGVNDNAKTLAELSEKLFSQKVLPYYLHSLDKAQGTARFEVPQQVANSILK